MISGIVVKGDSGKVKSALSATNRESIDASIPQGCFFIEGIQIDESRLKLCYYRDGSVYYTKTQQQIVEDNAWHNLRAHRDYLLSACDWTQVPDAPVDRQAWAEYRQALRDLPANTVDPREPVWPFKPE